VKDYYETKANFEDTEMKKDKLDHRLHSDYIRVLYDDGIELNIGNVHKKKKKHTPPKDSVALNS